MLEIVNIDLLLQHNYDSVLSELNVQDLALKVEFSKRPMLNVVPENESVAWIGCVVSCAHKADDVGSKQHFAKFDASFKI
jgi:hypothetical protein